MITFTGGLILGLLIGAAVVFALALYILWSPVRELRESCREAETENERVRQANLDVMMHFEDVKAAKEKAEARCSELEEQKHKLKFRLAAQAMHHVRLHNRWVCGDLEAPEEEAIVNPFVYAETEVWWAIGDEADGLGDELEAAESEGGEQ